MGLFLEEARDSRPHLMFDSFEAEQHVNFGQSGMVVNAVKRGLHLRHHLHHLFPVKFNNSASEHWVGDIGEFVLQAFEEREEVADDVVCIQVLEIYARVVDIHEVLYSRKST